MDPEGMVHALEEVSRVLKPGGLLVELRPAAVHRRVWVITSARRILVGTMNENLASDHAADAALKRFIQRAQPAAPSTTRTVCNRYLDSLKEFRGFLEEFEEPQQPIAEHKRLLKRVERAWTLAEGRKRIVVAGPLQITVMQKRA